MKIRELQQYMRKDSIDYSLFFNLNSSRLNPNFFYFAQFDGTGAVLIPRKGATRLIVSRLEIAHSKKNLMVWSRGRLSDILKRRLTKSGLKVGVDKDNMTVRELTHLRKGLEHAKFVSISQKCTELRRTKLNSELTRIRRACNVTQKILDDCIGRFNGFRKEIDVVGFLKRQALERNCELAFEPVVASGGYASIPHHKAKAIKLRKGFCVIDFGVKYKGYCADLTRTVFIGKPSQKQRNLFNKTSDIQMRLIDSIRPSVKTDSLFKKAKGVFGKLLIHAVGHGVGIEVHEHPFLGEEDTQEVLEGMVICVEPGVYSPRSYGIRLEDMVYVTKRKAQLLSKPQKFVIV